MDQAAVDSARAELRAKTKEQIEWETANKWGARAIAAYEFYVQTGNIEWLAHAVTYHGEAVEHGASAHPGQLRLIEEPLDRAQRAAFGKP